MRNDPDSGARKKRSSALCLPGRRPKPCLDPPRSIAPPMSMASASTPFRRGVENHSHKYLNPRLIPELDQMLSTALFFRHPKRNAHHRKSAIPGAQALFPPSKDRCPTPQGRPHGNRANTMPTTDRRATGDVLRGGLLMFLLA